MKRNLSKRILSLVLALTVLATALPMTTWFLLSSAFDANAIGDKEVLGDILNDKVLSAVGADYSVLPTGSDITVDYPVSGSSSYVQDLSQKPAGWTAEKEAECNNYVKMGVFDPVFYLQTNPDLVVNGSFHSSANGVITYYTYKLYEHYVTSGIADGRCASPFFCIGCYYQENSDLFYNAGINSYNDAWNHFVGELGSSHNHKLSPVFSLGDYNALNADLGNNVVASSLLEHFMANGCSTELRKASNTFDHIGYFYDNASLFYSSGALECYRQFMAAYTIGSVPEANRNDAQCYFHHGLTYSGLADLGDSFTATLTNIGVSKNIAVSNGNVAAAAAGAGADELWQFTKQANGKYTIKLADDSKALTYENTTEGDKYLSADSADDAKIILSSTEMQWSIYKNDGLYILRPECTGYNRHVLTVSDTNNINGSVFNTVNVNGYNYNENTLNQHFLINSTYATDADSDGLSAEFYACIDAYHTDGWDTRVSLTAGDIYLRTRQDEDGGQPCADQVWHFIRQSDGTYRIINTACGKYLDSDISQVPVKAIYVNDYKDSDSQKWIIRARENGGYFIMPLSDVASTNEGTYLTVLREGEDNLLKVDKFTGINDSVFDISVTSTHPYAHDLNGSDNGETSFYAYVSSAKTDMSQYYMVSGSERGTGATLQDSSNADKKKQDFYWCFEGKGDGSYVIYSTTLTDTCLTVDGGEVKLMEFDRDSALYISWFVFKYNGGYRIQLKATGQVLQMNEDGTLTLADANTNNYDDYQLFNIAESDMSISTVGETFKVSLFNYGTLINDTSDPDKVLDFTSDNTTIDKVNLSIGTGDGVIPEMSLLLDDNGYPVVNNYMFVSGTDGNQTHLQHNLKPNYATEGSLEYLFNVNRGYVGSSLAPSYDPKVENGDEYEIQTFNVLNPSGLFTKDAQGYYCYDSSDNAAYFDIRNSTKSSAGAINGTFKLFDYTTHPMTQTPFSDPNYQGAFLPFNLPHADGELFYGGNAYHYSHESDDSIVKANYSVPVITREVDHTNSTQKVISGDVANAIDMWFGMTLETDFFQTQGGKLNGQDVKFEFAGDDDVWVYLDGILALDIGNTHGKLEGEINFADSTVTRPVKTTYYYNGDTSETITYADGTLAHQWQKDANGYATETVSLYSVYYDALNEAVASGDADKAQETEATLRRSFGITGSEIPVPESVQDDPRYVDFEQHNLKLFYLERGAGASNCSIKLNTFSGGTTVSKEVTGLNEDIMAVNEYKFKIVEVDTTNNNKETPLANSPYTIASTFSLLSDDGVAALNNLETDENGCFTLKANQRAIFGKVSPGSYIKVYELTDDSSITNINWRTVIEGGVSTKQSGKSASTDIIKTPTDQTIDIIFTNDHEPSHNLKITKSFDTADSNDNYKPDPNQLYVIGYQLINKEDAVVVEKTVTLKDGDSIEIEDIPVGFRYRVWEYLPEGVLNFDIPQFTLEGKSYDKAFVPNGSSVGTNNYVEGTIEDKGTVEVSVRNKLQAHNNITITFKYYDRKRVNGAPAQINDYYSTFTKVLKAGEWEDAYFNNSTQRINFSAMIADQGAVFNNEIGVDNIIDEYTVWTSQSDAVSGIADEINYFAGDTDGVYSTYGETFATTPDKLGYHTDAYGNVCTCGEKWVTYYKGANVIDPENQGNDSDVTSITVWLFNRPKTYTLSMYTLEADDMTTANANGDLLIGNNKVDFNGFYNQRIGSKEDGENDTQNSQQYWDTYKLPADDFVKGYSASKTYDYLDLAETVTDNGTEYEFMYWSYDADGETVASTDINYSYRITCDMSLYAVYGKSGYEDAGLTVFENSVDSYVDANGKVKLRLNTMMSPYNCPDDDETITDAAIIYVFLHGADEYKNMTEDEILTELKKTDAEGNTYLDKLRGDIKAILNKNETGGKVYVVNAQVGANGFRYEVESFSGTTAKANLTAKNRIQFTTEFAKDDLKDKRMLAFAGMNKSGEWYVSDNFVDYDFINN